MTVLNQLRQLVPRRPLNDTEARSIAERQAAKFLALVDITEPHVPGLIIAELPRVDVQVRAGLPKSGVTHWDRSANVWRIWLRAEDAAVRQRFSLAHEMKHVLDDPFIDAAYPTLGLVDSARRAEYICDYFAACLLMPRPWIKRAWAGGIQQLDALSELFAVSPQAMNHRLTDLRLIQSRWQHHYYRADADSIFDEPIDKTYTYFRASPTTELLGAVA